MVLTMASTYVVQTSYDTQELVASSGAPAALQGRVFTTQPGVPVTVTAVAWPNQAVLDRLPIGAAVPLLRIPTVQTDGNAYTGPPRPRSGASELP
jgi:hypothetical protein